MAATFVNRSKRNKQSYQRTFNRRFLPSFGSFGLAVSEKIFRNRPTRNKNCLWRTCLLTDRNEMSNLKRGRRTPSDGKSSHCLWQGKLKTTCIQKPEALESLYRSPGYKKNQLVLCKNYVLQWQSSWNYDQHKKHKVCKGPSND